MGRSLAASTGSPFFFPFDFSKLKNIRQDKNGIFGIHDYFDKDKEYFLNKNNFKFIGIERNFLDHLLSYCMNQVMTVDEYISISKSENFKNQRSIMFSVPEKFRVSYDNLLKSESDCFFEEITKISNILDIDKIYLDSPKHTEKIMGPAHSKIAKSEKWKKFLSYSEAKKICEENNEEIFFSFY